MVSKDKYTCVTIGFNTPRRAVERLALSYEDAANAAARAMHTAYWAEPWRSGHDSHGHYEEFTVTAGSRLYCTVRVYKEYL